MLAGPAASGPFLFLKVNLDIFEFHSSHFNFKLMLKVMDHAHQF